MSSHANTDHASPLDLSRWRGLPKQLMIGGGVLALLGALVNLQEFAFAWLLAFMFFLSLGLGGLFLTILHHLVDASWSVPVRRVNETFARLLPWMAALFIPIALLAPKYLYPWMQKLLHGETDHALHAKYPLLTIPMFYVVAAICFGVWAFLARRLHHWSVKQDETGAVECTHKMRLLSYWGIFAFGFSMTLAVIMWMKALQHQWFSTMYGVYYFAGSVWLTVATLYLVTMILKQQGPLRDVVQEKQFYFIGSLLFAFTVFYAYVTFSQYFIIWNANMPEETFFYVLRGQGTWWDVGMIIIFGHFFVPFLALLRIDLKLKFWWMAPLCAWAWLMHLCDMYFNIKPVLHPEGISALWIWLDLGCLAFMGGFLAQRWLKIFNAHPPFPQKDPRFAEALGIYVPSASEPQPAASHGGRP
ncbi:MAG: hypothetical protein HYZ36_06730 [Pedosphaera parvula]|nr:hypothetical protein [Pedosphaera parvula]